MIIPAIDFMDEKIVQLVNGKRVAIELEYSREFVKQFAKFKELQVVDINAAMGNGCNTGLVREICKLGNARVGGGIRSISDAVEKIDQGARKVIIGTMATESFLEELCMQIGNQKIIVALDSKAGNVVTGGWVQNTGKDAFEMITELEEYCCEFFYTAVDREGEMKGFDLGLAKRLKNATKNRVVVAGGISSEKEVNDLEKIGVDCVVGMALYTGKINLGGVKFGED